jgi:hypothetical protein
MRSTSCSAPTCATCVCSSAGWTSSRAWIEHGCDLSLTTDQDAASESALARSGRLRSRGKSLLS